MLGLQSPPSAYNAVLEIILLLGKEVQRSYAVYIPLYSSQQCRDDFVCTQLQSVMEL